MSKVTVSGFQVDFDAAVNLMDDEIREELHSTDLFAWEGEQAFVDAYAVAHETKFGETFTAG